MAWIGLRDARTAWFRPTEQIMAQQRRLLVRGSLVLEAQLTDTLRPQTLVSFSRTGLVPGRFSLQVLPRGGVVLVDARGDDIRHATIPFMMHGRLDTLRLTYSWDCDGGWGRLTLELPEADRAETVAFNMPLPLPAEALESLMMARRDAVLGDSAVFVAVADTPQPVGPMPALTSNVTLETAAGPRPVSRIARGDLLYTETGQLVPVLRVVKRTVPARGCFRPIRLRAPFFGLREDAVVAPQERLVMTGTQVEYLFGRETVLVPAAHLVNECSAFLANGPDLVTYYHVLLAENEAVLSGDCAFESLYIGRLRRKPEVLMASVLAGFDRSRLPEHAKRVSQVLKPFEAVTLALTRVA